MLEYPRKGKELEQMGLGLGTDRDNVRIATLRARRREVLDIATRHGARNVRMFGSVVRGEAGHESDIDLLVDVGPDHSPWFPAGLEADREALLGRPVDVVTEDALHWYIRERVLAEAVPL